MSKSARRINYVKNSTPGVGAYNTSNLDNTVYSRGKSTRFESARKKSQFDLTSETGHVGPGHYNNLDTINSSKNFKVTGGTIGNAPKSPVKKDE